ncbi:MAG: DUF4870 domain-containing protein [Chitinophagales bacterium]|nr:DUF4870 domain-containing protein [Chitinophagales bacterium]
MIEQQFAEVGFPDNYTPTQDERNLSLIVHLVTFVSSFIAPLIIYLVKKDESRFIAAHAKESLNFQITVVIIGILMFISLIGILFLWALGLAAAILVVVATIKASDGKPYRYPFSIRFIK